MENIKISKTCGLCAGCRFAIKTAKDSLKTHKNVSLFKEIVHNAKVNENLISLGINIKNSLDELSPNEFVILRAHGEPLETYDYLKCKGIEYADCTCANVKKIHEEVNKFSIDGYKIIIIGNYGKKNKKTHPEVLGTIGWCKTPPVLVEDEDDLSQIKNIKNEKFYLVCQTTFNIKRAEELCQKIKDICSQNNNELVINLSICNAQKLINISSAELANECDIMFVVGSKTSNNTTELFNNLIKVKPTFFLENIEDWQDVLKQNNFTINKNTKVGITAGASTNPEELVALKSNIENYLLENFMNINVNKHSSIQIENIFFDPYLIEDKSKKARLIFLTHTHYDHLSIEDVNKIVVANTTFIATKDAAETLEKEYPNNKKIYISPNESFEIENIKVETLPAYNINKNFHKREFNWVGYKLTIGGITCYIAGDTDITPELENLSCDVLFVPIGGTYTMNATEAAILTNKIEPKLVVPMHYNAIVGNKEDEKTFISKLNKNIEYKIFL